MIIRYCLLYSFTSTRFLYYRSQYGKPIKSFYITLGSAVYIRFIYVRLKIFFTLNCFEIGKQSLNVDWYDFVSNVMKNVC